MFKAFRLIAAVAVAMVALATSAIAQTLKPGDVCFTNWHNQAQTDVKAQPERNRGAQLFAILSGNTISVYGYPGYDGFNLSLPPARLDGFRHYAEVTLKFENGAYEYEYHSPMTNRLVRVTLKLKSAGVYEFILGPASAGNNRTGTGTMTCQANSPLFNEIRLKQAMR